MQQQHELRKANTEMPVPSPPPNTPHISETPGCLQIHKLVFSFLSWTGLAGGPFPLDVPLIQGQNCKVTLAHACTLKALQQAVMKGNTFNMIFSIWSFQYHHKNTGKPPCERTRSFPPKRAGKVFEGRNLFRHSLAVSRNPGEQYATKQSQEHVGKQRRDSAISFYSLCIYTPASLSGTWALWPARHARTLKSVPWKHWGSSQQHFYVTDELIWKSAWLSQLSVPQFGLSSWKDCGTADIQKGNFLKKHPCSLSCPQQTIGCFLILREAKWET